MSNAYETLLEAKTLGITIREENGQLRLESYAGVLKRALKAHKTDILYLLSLPEPAKPGAEVEELRRKIGEMVRQEHVRCEHGA